MVKSAQNRAIALFETTLPEAVAEKQAVIRDYASALGLEIINFFAIHGTLEAGVKEALRVAVEKKAHNIIVDSASTMRMPLGSLVNAIDQFAHHGVTVHVADRAARFDRGQFIALKELLKASEQANFHVRSALIKEGLKRKLRPHSTRRFGKNVEEEAVIERIRELHDQGMSLQKIAEMLALSDIKTVQNKKWHPTTIKRIVDRAKKRSHRN